MSNLRTVQLSSEYIIIFHDGRKKIITESALKNYYTHNDGSTLKRVVPLDTILEPIQCTRLTSVLELENLLANKDTPIRDGINKILAYAQSFQNIKCNDI